MQCEFSKLIKTFNCKLVMSECLLFFVTTDVYLDLQSGRQNDLALLTQLLLIDEYFYMKRWTVLQYTMETDRVMIGSILRWLKSWKQISFTYN